MPDTTNKIVGIDLGFRSTGVVVAAPSHSEPGYVLLECLCAKTEKADKKKGLYVAHDDVTQCQALYAEVMAFLQKHSPKALVVELPSAGAKGARANRGMGIATGMVAAITAQLGLPNVWVQPDESKKLVGGKRNTSKEEIEAHVMGLWPNFAWPKKKCELEHVADAAAALLVARSSDVYKFLRGTTEG